MKRFTSAALDIPSTTEEVLANALTQGLQEGDFFISLAKKPTRNFDDLLARAKKYINLEKAHRIKKEDDGGKKDNKKGMRKRYCQLC